MLTFDVVNYLDVTGGNILVVIAIALTFGCWLRQNADNGSQIGTEGEAADPRDNNRDSPVRTHSNNYCSGSRVVIFKN